MIRLLSQSNRSSMFVKKGQAIIEFTFCMIVVFVMIYGMMMVFRWTGSGLAARRVAHDNILTQPVAGTYYTHAESPANQLTSYFYGSEKMNAAFSYNN